MTTHDGVRNAGLVQCRRCTQQTFAHLGHGSLHAVENFPGHRHRRWLRSHAHILPPQPPKKAPDALIVWEYAHRIFSMRTSLESAGVVACRRMNRAPIIVNSFWTGITSGIMRRSGRPFTAVTRLWIARSAARW